MSAVKITAVDMKPMSASGVCLIQICEKSKIKEVWGTRAWYTTGAQHDSLAARGAESMLDERSAARRRETRGAEHERREARGLSRDEKSPAPHHHPKKAFCFACALADMVGGDMETRVALRRQARHKLVSRHDLL